MYQRLSVMLSIVLYVLAPLPAWSGQKVDTVLLERLTWNEVKALIDKGTTTIILPTGGTEQNGPHMALGKHNVIVQYAAEQIARRLGNALVAPVLAYVPEGSIDPPSGHMRFPGTISLPEPYFDKVIEYAARSFRANGFKDIVLIGDSGGNWNALKKVSKALNHEWAKQDVRVHYVDQFNRGSKFQKWLNARGESDQAIGTHAGIMDTSVMLAVDPSMVRSNKLAASNDFYRTGVMGDPRRASAEYGRKGLSIQVDGAVEQIKRLTARK